MEQVDYLIAGAGIIGAAVARTLTQRYPGARIVVVDKEAAPAQHQTGRNSGVIHAGVYYAPGSLKAKFCREGLDATIAFCRQYDLPYEQCGKLIVATGDSEQERLNTLYDRCKANDLSPSMVSQHQLEALEPNITGKEAFFVDQTGITDYTAITLKLLSLATEQGALTVFGYRISDLKENESGIDIKGHHGADAKHFRAQCFINCAGIHADTLLKRQGLSTDIMLLPFKGVYHRLSSEFDQVTQRLIYPVPDPTMPFLGVHLTRMIGGYTTVGPNAVLAPGKEAYDMTGLSVSDLISMAGFSGLRKLLWHFRGQGLNELKSTLSKHYYASLVQRYCPAVKAEHFRSYRPGIRAQAVRRNGEMVQDFEFVRSPHSLHVINAPSPAATSAMPIAQEIVSRL